MKKYLLFVLMCTSLTSTNVFAGIYGADLIKAQQWADERCSSNPTQFIFNPIDNGSFFECVDTGGYQYRAELKHCGTDIYDVEGLKFPLMYDKSTGRCERDYSLDEITTKINNGSYVRACDKNYITCDCRDSPRDDVIYGTCKCSDYGTHMDYSTCTAAPPCTQIKDINGIDRAEYDLNTKKCYAPAGYAFSDTRGNYEFTSNCIYSN